MPRQRFSGLGKAGLNTDVETSLLPLEAWSTLINIECQDGSLRSAHGESKLFDIAIEPIYHTTFVEGEFPTVIVSDGVNIRAYRMDGSHRVITPETGTPAVSAPWSQGRVTFTNLNGVLVVNSQSDGPFYWGGWDTKLKPLPGWPTGWTCRAMCAYRYYLVAIGMFEKDSGTGVVSDFKHKVCWSGSAAEGEVPTVWIPALSNDAGDDILGETPGALVGGVLVRDSLMLVKEDDLFTMNWIGGQYVMQVTRNKGGVGTRSTYGYSEMRGAVVTMTSADVLAFDGQQSQSLMYGRVREWYRRRVSSEQWEKSALFVHYPSRSLYIAIVKSGYTYITEVLRYDWSSDTWSAFTVSDAYGLDELMVRMTLTPDPWDEASSKPWNDPGSTPWDRGIYAPSVTDVIVYESNRETAAPGEEKYWVSVRAITETDSQDSPKFVQAMRTGLPLEGVSGVAMVTRIWPEMDGNAPFKLWVGGQQRLDETPVWTGPYDVIPRVTESIPLRVTGRFLGFRVESEVKGYWRLSALTVQHEPAGER